MLNLDEDIMREIGQHFVFGFHGHELSEDIKMLVRDYFLGNVILMKRNIRDATQVHRIVHELQLLAKQSGHEKPLLIGIDQENGLVSAFSSTVSEVAGTQFPGAMALAATGSVQLAEQVSAASGRELKLAGINWAYSPVADINSDPRNPVIGVRSFGDDATQVGKFANAVSRGLNVAGVAPSAKHFPGHGDTHVDSHLALPRILKTKANLLAEELVPFSMLIRDQIPTLMTGHMALPLVTGDDKPCSLSETITTDLLRGELGFRGVVVTDCLEMDAVAEIYGSQAGAVLSLKAGADIAMICHTLERQRGAIEATYNAVRTGELSMERLKLSGERIAHLKETYAGTWDGILNAKFEDKSFRETKKENLELAAHAYAASIALMHDPLRYLPFKKEDFVVLFTPIMESLNKAVDDAEGILRTEKGHQKNTAGSSYLAFAKSIARRAEVKHVVYFPEHSIPMWIYSASSIIFTTRNADRSPWQIDYLRNVLHGMQSPIKTVVLGSCAPYDLRYVDDLQVAYIASFEFTPNALEAAAAVIFGEKRASGVSPVSKGGINPDDIDLLDS